MTSNEFGSLPGAVGFDEDESESSESESTELESGKLAEAIASEISGKSAVNVTVIVIENPAIKKARKCMIER